MNYLLVDSYFMCVKILQFFYLMLIKIPNSYNCVTQFINVVINEINVDHCFAALVTPQSFFIH